MNRLKKRWGIQTNGQMAIIFIVFAITGSSAAYLAKPLLELLGLTKEVTGWFYLPLRLLLIFPIYQLLLVFYGSLFGQFAFFWNFEKRMLQHMRLGFIVNWVERRRG